MFDVLVLQAALTAALDIQRQRLNQQMAAGGERRYAPPPVPVCEYCGTKPWPGERRCVSCGAPVPTCSSDIPGWMDNQIAHNRIYGVSPLYPELYCRVKA